MLSTLTENPSSKVVFKQLLVPCMSNITRAEYILFNTTDFRACQYELLCPESAEVDEELMTPTYQEN